MISSDFCRGLVADDENDQSATSDAFDVLHYIVGQAAGRRAAHRGRRHQRAAGGPRGAGRSWPASHDVLPVAIVLDVPEAVCARAQPRAARPRLRRRRRPRQHDQLRRSLRGLRREGFRKVHVLRGVDEIDAAQIVREPPAQRPARRARPVRRHRRRARLPRRARAAARPSSATTLVRDDAGRAVDAAHPEGRRVVFVGDLVDRGPDTPGVLRLVMGMVAAGHALCGARQPRDQAGPGAARAQGPGHPRAGRDAGAARRREPRSSAHEARAVRATAWSRHLRARRRPARRRARRAEGGLPRARLGPGALASRSTATPPARPTSTACRCATRGRRTTAAGRWCVYGHTPIPTPEWVNNTICLDTGCVFGGRLTALRYPERETVVRSPREQVWYEPVKPLARQRRRRRGRADELDLDDVDRATGSIETAPPSAGSPSARRTPPARWR